MRTEREFCYGCNLEIGQQADFVLHDVLLPVRLQAVDELVVDELHGLLALLMRVLVEHGIDDVLFDHFARGRRVVEGDDRDVLLAVQGADGAAGAVGAA